MVVGVVLALEERALALNLGGAADWWVNYSTRQRQEFGRGIGPPNDRGSARWLGVVTLGIGALFVVVGLDNL